MKISDSLLDVRNAPLRPARFFTHEIEIDKLDDGVFVMRSAEPLAPYDAKVGDWIDRWAEQAPDRIFLVEQTAEGEKKINYAQTREAALAYAEGLLSYDLGPDRPIAILAGNGIDHALIMLAAYYVGIPVVPIAPAYALQTHDYVKLAHSFRLMTPGMIIVEDGEIYRKALEMTLPAGVPVFALNHPTQIAASASGLRGDGRRKAAVMSAAALVGPDTIAKFLFTSGSTGVPKAVINTHRMLCSNSQMQRQVTAFIADEPPIMVDWLPWNHTAGGNSIINLVLSSGGTLYIDPGRPTPEMIDKTIEMLRRVSPTIYFNVPLGFDILIPYFEADAVLRESFFRNLKFLWYSAAAMTPTTWAELERLAVQTTGQRILTVTGLGMTESSPLALFGNHRATGVGIIGVPVPGLELKLVQIGDEYETRYRGPNITPGYWRDKAATEASFDSEGFFLTGDLVSFVDPQDPGLGLRFEGRAGEDFKLTSGTRVSGAGLRIRVLEALRPLAAEVLVVGAGRDDVRALIFPDWKQCAAAIGGPLPFEPTELARNEKVKALFRERMTKIAATGTGASNRVVAGLLVETPPSVALGEVTDKGSVNGRLLQRNRPELLDILFEQPRHALVVLADLK